MMRQTAFSRHRQRLAGVVLIAIGGMFYLDQSGIVDARDLWHYWPLLLMAVGAMRMHAAHSARDVTSGLWSVVVGAWLLVNLEGWFGSDFNNSWPCLLIAWGATLLLRPAIARRFPNGRHGDPAVQMENENAR